VRASPTTVAIFAYLNSSSTCVVRAAIVGIPAVVHTGARLQGRSFD